jgi:predicted N-acetyltransferase YhbS
MITYRVGNNLDLDTVIAVYEDSTLGERRPIKDRKRMAAMIRNANLVVTAWDGYRLVGIARSISDFAYVTHLSDLAVSRAYQRRGIGKELIRQTQAAGGPNTQVLLLAAPGAKTYYPHIGFVHHPQACVLNPG